MGREFTEGRILLDVTGYLIVPKQPETQLPLLRQPVPLEFFEKATNKADKMRRGSFESYANVLFGRGNWLKGLILDQEPGWKVMRAWDIKELEEEKISWVESVAKKAGSYFRDPKWLPRPGTAIELEDFEPDTAQIKALEKDKRRKTIISGNSYWQRRDLVKMLRKDMTRQLDPLLGIVLPPHYDVGSGLLKIGGGVWFKEGQREAVEARDDDFAIALLYSVLGIRTRMPIDEVTARNQPHVEGIIKASGVASLIKEDLVNFKE